MNDISLVSWGVARIDQRELSFLNSSLHEVTHGMCGMPDTCLQNSNVEITLARRTRPHREVR